MRLIFFSVVLFCISSSVYANTWPLYLSKRGSLLGASALNGLEHTEIIKENLFIRFMPENGSVNVQVIAEYLIEHKDVEKDIDMEFICGSKTSAFSLLYDGITIETNRERSPCSIQRMPKYLPGILDKPYAVPNLSVSDHVDCFNFKITLREGRHTITAKYMSDIASYSRTMSAVTYFQFIYVLFPAKAWEKFGTLEITIDYPQGWHIASEPVLKNNNNQIKGSFSDIPSEFLTVSLAAPDHYKRIEFFGIMIYIIAVLTVSLLFVFVESKIKHGNYVKILIRICLSLAIYIIIRVIGINLLLKTAEYPEFISSAFIYKHYDPLWSVMSWIVFFPVTLLTHSALYTLIRTFRKQ